MNFETLGLTQELQDAVKKKGYKNPTPIQAQSIPAILEKKDVLGGAQTGTGKTAAFALPILHNLNEAGPAGKAPRALILTPTRELAAQVGESFQNYGSKLPLKTAIVFGGVKINPQIGQLRQGTDILVATPGRLLDHLSQRTLDLRSVETLVLDEADRMLDMGFIRDIKKIIQALPRQRQNLLFSATYSKEIRTLAEDLLKNPVMVEVARRNKAADKVEQFRYSISKTQKRHLLAHLIKSESWYQVLVFVRTKHGANRLTKQLVKQGIPSAAIHGDKSQNARTRALAEFKKGDLQALIATDVAARGIHLEELSHVVNFDLPQVPEDYIHRIGRTGRAGKSGIAISLICSDEKDIWRRIQKLLTDPVTELEPKGFTPGENPAPRDSERQRNPQGNRPRHNSSGQSRNKPGNNRRRSTSRSPKQANQEQRSSKPRAEREQKNNRDDLSPRTSRNNASQSNSNSAGSGFQERYYGGTRKPSGRYKRVEY